MSGTDRSGSSAPPPDAPGKGDEREAAPARGDMTLDILIESLSEITDPEVRGRFLLDHPQLRCREAVEGLTDRVASLVLSDLGRAERLADAAVRLAALMNDSYAAARSRRATAHVSFSRGRWADAAEGYMAAVQDFETLGVPIEVGRTLSSALQALIYLGRYEEALAHAERARAIFTAAKDNVRLARLDSNLANLFFRQDRFAEALALYEKARRQFATLGLSQDVAVTLRNIATVQISLHQFDESLKTFGEARAYCERLGLPLLALVAEYNIAYAHYLRGHYTKAIQLYRETRERCAVLGDEYHKTLCDLDQSEMYLDLNLVEQARELAEAACSGFERLGMRYERAKAMTFMAMALSRSERTYPGLDLFLRAREVFESDGNAIWVAQIDLYRALVLQREGRLYEAMQMCRASARFFETAGQEGRAALCETVLAQISLQAGEAEAARATCHIVLDRLGRTDVPAVRYQVLHLLGQAEERLGAKPEATLAYKRATDALRDLRTHLGRDELKIGFLKDKTGVFESWIGLALKGDLGPHEAIRVFGLVELAKARAIADLVAFHAPSLPARGKARSDLVAEVHRIREQLNWHESHGSLAEVRDLSRQGRDLATHERESRRLENELVRTLGALSEAPEFVSLQRGTAVDTEAIREALPSQATLIEYYVARGTLLACVLTRRDAHVAPLAPWGFVERLTRGFEQQMIRRAPGVSRQEEHADEQLAAVRSHLRRLHSVLIRPLGQALTERLIVVPHGTLHYLPFHALFDGHRYLGEDHVISCAPSASSYALARTRRRAARGQGALVMAGPGADSTRWAKEAAMVAGALRESTVFAGEEATMERLRQVGGKSRFVHLATTAHGRSDNPMFSSFSLAGSPLTLYDLFSLDLPAELVTVTGSGWSLRRARSGEEIVGLSRGLSYAGAAASLYPLWDAGAEAANELLPAFYRRLVDAGDAAVALRDAMGEFRGRRPHPFDWASFVVSGDTEPAGRQFALYEPLHSRG